MKKLSIVGLVLGLICIGSVFSLTFEFEQQLLEQIQRQQRAATSQQRMKFQTSLQAQSHKRNVEQQLKCSDGRVLPAPGKQLHDCGTGKYWVLTFDDVPSDHFLDLLATYGVHVTFFIEGNVLDNEPSSRTRLARAYREGHFIGHHSYSHLSYAQAPLKNNCTGIKWEMDYTNTLIRQAIGVPTYTPKYFRPPFGDMDNFAVAAVNSYGYTVVQWNLDPEDWRETEVSPDDILLTVRSGITNTTNPNVHPNPNDNPLFFFNRGSILMLAHDRPTDNIYCSMWEAIPEIWEAGFKLVTVDQCDCLSEGKSEAQCGVTQQIPSPIPRYAPTSSMPPCPPPAFPNSYHPSPSNTSPPSTTTRPTTTTTRASSTTRPTTTSATPTTTAAPSTGTTGTVYIDAYNSSSRLSSSTNLLGGYTDDDGSCSKSLGANGLSLVASSACYFYSLFPSCYSVPSTSSLVITLRSPPSSLSFTVGLQYRNTACSSLSASVDLSTTTAASKVVIGTTTAFVFPFSKFQSGGAPLNRLHGVVLAGFSSSVTLISIQIDGAPSTSTTSSPATTTATSTTAASTAASTTLPDSSGCDFAYEYFDP